ncbi:hypothetical protein [Pontibacter roseus]|uniref:hypothetical protein n=1 Tax=Pontibacter roseus TaxID=336989 RepID=UPI000380DC8B|nr:hypothetical protein [Pontibacter roseus]
MNNIYARCYGWLLSCLCLFSFVTASGQGTNGKEFLLKVGNVRGQIEWEQSTDRRNWTAIPHTGSKEVRLRPTQTTLYRAKITEAGCSPIYSEVKGAVFTKQGVIGAKLVSGRVTLPEGAAVAVGELNMLSFVEEDRIHADGSFQVLVPDSVDEDILIVTNRKEEVVMLGHFVGSHEEYVMSSTTSAEALLAIYPGLMPVTADEKAKLKERYREEKEYKDLVKLVTRLNSQGLPLFSAENKELASTLSILVQKYSSKEGLRKASTDPVYISKAHKSSVAIANTTTFGYVGQVYRMKDMAKVGPQFIIAGDLVRDNTVAAALMKYWVPSVEIKENEVTVNLPDYGAVPGEYEIVVRSGLANDYSPEDHLASQYNLKELIALTVASMTSFSVPLKDECLKSIVQANIEAINPISMKNAIRNNSLFSDYVMPIIKELGNAGAYCLNVNKALGKLAGIMEVVDTALPFAWYAGEWLLKDAAVDGCQYLNPDYETSNCFEIKAVTNLKDRYFPGDTLEIKIKAEENKLYYPYTGEDAAFRRFTWMKKGESHFALPQSAELFYDRTNVKGEATIKWVLSCKEEVNSVQAWIQGVDESLRKNLFATRTKVPAMAVVKLEGADFQKGEKGKKLPNPIGFSIKDLDDGSIASLVKLNRFNIKWEVFRNNSWRPVPNTGVINDIPNIANALFWVRKEWTLDNHDDQQKIRATIEDKCGEKWNIEGNPVVFSTERNPWIDTLVGKWTYEIYTKYFVDSYYKSHESAWQVNVKPNRCWYNYKPIGDNTVVWTEYSNDIYEFSDSLTATNQLTMTKVHEYAPNTGKGCTNIVQKYDGSWRVTSSGNVYVTLFGNINGKEITLSDEGLWGQLERIDDNTFKVNLDKCKSEWGSCISWAILRRQ